MKKKQKLELNFHYLSMTPISPASVWIQERHVKIPPTMAQRTPPGVMFKHYS